jgi:hypothetical protein
MGDLHRQPDLPDGSPCGWLSLPEALTQRIIPYLVKNSGEVMEVPNIFFGKRMANFLRDCSLTKQKIEENKLGRKDLDQIVDDYNRCLDNQTLKVFPSEDPKLVAITQLKDRLKQNPAVPADAIEIMDDMYQKVKEKKPTPNYMTSALRGLLRDYPDYHQELDSLITKLKG